MTGPVWLSLHLLVSMVLFLEFGKLVRLVRVCRHNDIPCSRSIVLAGVFVGLALALLGHVSREVTSLWQGASATVAMRPHKPAGSEGPRAGDLEARSGSVLPKRGADTSPRTPGSAPQEGIAVSFFSGSSASETMSDADLTAGDGTMHATVFQARVARVADGDSLLLESGVRVVLAGVNAPELARGGVYDDPVAEAAYAFSRDLVEGMPVTLEVDPRGRDRYGRLVAYIWREGTFLNRALVAQGLAEVLPGRAAPKYRPVLTLAEAAARRDERGIWEGGPWPVVGNRASGIYHLPGDSFYFKVGVKNRVFFPSEEAARTAHFRRASF